jgi:glycogen debranching enzyme
MKTFIPWYRGELPYLTVRQMVEVDRAMVEDFGIGLVRMMENAGRALAHLARARFLGGDARGRKVEINALWYNALRSMAEKIFRGFARFFRDDLGHCLDVLDGPEGNDASMRPNQILAVSLPHSPLSESWRQSVVDACARDLLTPLGLRSLSPEDSRYTGHYGGDAARRDGAYHQGTVWPWLIGPFVTAHLRVYRDPAIARSFLLPLLRHMDDHGLGSICEIADGDPPFTPRGCVAQAWSVAKTLRASFATRIHFETSESPDRVFPLSPKNAR